VIFVFQTYRNMDNLTKEQVIEKANSLMSELNTLCREHGIALFCGLGLSNGEYSLAAAGSESAAAQLALNAIWAYVDAIGKAKKDASK
jgi:hypothetical protein